jgi:hypothetical protein
MSIKKVLLLCLAIALLVVFALVLNLVMHVSDTGFSEDNVRAYAHKFIELHPDWIPKQAEAVIQDINIEKMNLHDQELYIAKVNVRLRRDFETWKTLYLVCAPDSSTYVISDKEYLLNEIDRDGYAKILQQRQAEQTPVPTATPTPTSTVIYREFPAPTKAP